MRRWATPTSSCTNTRARSTAYTKAADADPENLDVQRGLASNLVSDGQNQAALKVLNNIVSADPAGRADAACAWPKSNAAWASSTTPTRTSKKPRSLVPDSQEVPYNEAVILESQGRLDEAAALLNTLIDKGAHPNLTAGEKNNRAIFLERLGNIYKEQNKTRAGGRNLSQDARLGKDQEERGYSDIIDAYREARQWPQATAAAQEAAKAMPNDKSMTLVLASQLTDSGKVNEGLALAKAQLHKGNDREVYLDLSQIYSRLRRFKEAEDALHKAEALSTKPEEQEYIQFLWGSLYEREKRYDEAEQAFRKVLANDPQNAMALNYLGYMLAEARHPSRRSARRREESDRTGPAELRLPRFAGMDLFQAGQIRSRRAVPEPRGTEVRQRRHRAQPSRRGLCQDRTLKQAAAQWERAMQEYNRASPGDNDPTEVADAQKNLDRARVRLAEQQQH